MNGDNPSRFNGDEHPEEVSWNDAQTFLQKLNALRPGLDVGLPTEAQCEYACRAGTQEVRYGELEAVAWYDGNASDSTHPVGLKAPNAWGLHDILGNVWEWCQDYSDDYQVVGDITENPLGPSRGVRRVLRGGSWHPRSARAGCGPPRLRPGERILALRAPLVPRSWCAQQERNRPRRGPESETEQSAFSNVRRVQAIRCEGRYE